MGSVFDNIMLLSDSYKTSHWRQYPEGTEYVYSYFESRGGKFAEVTFFGLQYIIKRYLTGQVVTAAKIDQAEKIINGHMGQGEMAHFNRKGWEHILKKHGGRLPIAIKAVPEGMTVPNRNVLMTVVNTDPEAFWLTNYLETLLVQVWYPMTVATQSREMKKIITSYFEKTGTEVSPLSIGFQLNDFGVRGVSSMETAAIGGAGHLLNFMGTDNMPAIMLTMEYYNADGPTGFSIPAAEHSTITSWTKSKEKDAYKNMLTQYPKGLVAVVSDSYDIYNAVSKLWGQELKSMVEGREGRLVIRPDSGDPPKIVVEVLELLGKAFGTSTTPKGFKLLPPYVRIIQGDGVGHDTIGAILENMAKHKWAAENTAFGSGGALLQKLNRDTQKCAFKCCEAVVHGEPVAVFKDPVTDPGKASKKGRLRLVKDRTGAISTLTDGQGDDDSDLLVEVFRDGSLLRDWKWDELKARAELGKTVDKV